VPDGHGDGGGILRRGRAGVAVSSVIVGLAVRVTMRRVRVHVHVAGVPGGGGALLVPGHRAGGAVGGVVDGERLAEVRALVVARGDGVDHHGDHGGAHGDEAGEGEPAAAAERVEGGGQDVHHAGGEDDPRGERLDGEEDVPVGAQRGGGAAQERDQHPRRSRRQDGRHRDELQPQRPARVLLLDDRRLRLRRAAAVAPRGRLARGCRR